jgi:hypothetical protein
LDAALVGSIVEEDLAWGRQLSRKEKAAGWAWEILSKNMAGEIAGTLSFQFDFAQGNDQIFAEGRARVELPFFLGALAGGGRREIEVNKKMSYQGNYK